MRVPPRASRSFALSLALPLLHHGLDIQNVCLDALSIAVERSLVNCNIALAMEASDLLGFKLGPQVTTGKYIMHATPFCQVIFSMYPSARSF